MSLSIQRKNKDPHGYNWTNNIINNPDLYQMILNTFFNNPFSQQNNGADIAKFLTLDGNNAEILKQIMGLTNKGLTFGQKMGLGAVSSVLGTGGQLLTNWMNQRWAQQQQEAQWAKEEEFATTAFNRQKELIETYQTPEAQRGLLEDAGLNVGMMYSKGGGTVGGASVSKASAAGGAVPMMGNPLAIDSMMSMMKTLAEIKNINADTNNKEAETGNKMLTANEQAWKNYILENTVGAQTDIITSEATIKKCESWIDFVNLEGNVIATAAENAIKGLQQAIWEIQKNTAEKKYDYDWSDPQWSEDNKILGGGVMYMEWQKLHNELLKQGIDISKEEINLDFLKTEKAMGVLGSILRIIGLAK